VTGVLRLQLESWTPRLQLRRMRERFEQQDRLLLMDPEASQSPPNGSQ
jgi:hypothetical protein